MLNETSGPKRGFASVFSFRDYRKFLENYVSYRKTAGNYSLTRLSEDIGFQSCNYAGLIVSGKRNLSLADALRVSHFMKFTEAEARYFDLLVRYNDASDPKQRKFYKSWLMEARLGFSKVELAPRDVPELLSEWHLPAVLSCLHPETGCSAEVVAELTGLKIAAVKRALYALVKNQLARDENGLFFVESGEVFDAKFGKHFRYKEFQRAQMQRSFRALEGHPDNSARFASYTFLLNDETLPRLRSRIRELTDSVDTTQAPTDGATLTQLNVQIFEFKDGNDR